MQIGFMRGYRRPNKFVRVLAKACGYYNIELVYFNPHDVNIDEGIIQGKILKNNRWTTVDMNVPAYIDITPYVFKHRNVIKFLKSKSTLSLNRRLKSKDEIYDKILEDGKFSNLIIPYSSYTDYKDIKSFSKQHEAFILKPQNGLRGNKIFKVSRVGRKFRVSYFNEVKEMKERQFKLFIEENLKENKYVIQKYIPSNTKEGKPFDCRIRLEKNGKGKWAVAVYLVRIGNNNVVSNVAKGGSVSELTPFLKANFENDAENVKEEIKKIAKELPYKVEELLQQNLTSMGIDLGFDKHGKPYLFEVELGPGYEFGIGEVVSLKADYYNYLQQSQVNSESKIIPI